MSHSSSRSRKRLRIAPSLFSSNLGDVVSEGGIDDTGFHPPPSAPAREDAMRTIGAQTLRLRRREARCLVDPLDEILAEAALHLGMHRHQFADPGLLLGLGEDVNFGLA